MKKWFTLVVLAVAGFAAVMAIRRLLGSGYEDDDIDAAGQGDTFGERAPSAPEQRWAPAETRTDITPERLSEAARVGVSVEAIRTVWPVMTEAEINGAEGDLDRLSRRIAEKAEQSVDEVRQRLDGILAQETPRASYPAH